MKTYLARPEHQVAYDELIQLIDRHTAGLTALEMLAVAANMVGKMVALQDQRRVTPAIAMEVVAHNIEHGNQDAIKQLAAANGRKH